MSFYIPSFVDPKYPKDQSVDLIYKGVDFIFYNIKEE
jgi:hypothetical protein